LNGDEVAEGTDPSDFCSLNPQNQNLFIVSEEWLTADCDGDGIPNADECE